MTISLMIVLALSSCGTSTTIVSVSHFQDAAPLQFGEIKSVVMAEQALNFRPIANTQIVNNFFERPIIVTESVRLGLGKEFEVGLKVLPVYTDFVSGNFGGNLFLKKSKKIDSVLSAGLIFMGGYSAGHYDTVIDNVFSLIGSNRVVDRKGTLISRYVRSLYIFVPITYSTGTSTFSFVPQLGLYKADMFYNHNPTFKPYWTIENANHSTYFTPALSANAQVHLPFESFITFELTAISIEKVILGFYSIGFGGRRSLF